MFHDTRERFGGSSFSAGSQLYCLTAWSMSVGMLLPRR